MMKREWVDGLKKIMGFYAVVEVVHGTARTCQQDAR